MVADAQWIQQALDEFEAPLVRYARSLLGDVELAREVVQETFLRLCRQKKSKVADHLAQWLFTVCRNRALEVRRKENRMQPLKEARAETLTSPIAGPDRRTEAREALTHLDRAMAELSNNEQEVIRLKFQHGLSYKEISAVTRLSVSNVGFILHTGLKKVRSELAAVGFGAPVAAVRRIK